MPSRAFEKRRKKRMREERPDSTIGKDLTTLKSQLGKLLGLFGGPEDEQPTAKIRQTLAERDQETARRLGRKAAKPSPPALHPAQMRPRDRPGRREPADPFPGQGRREPAKAVSRPAKAVSRPATPAPQPPDADITSDMDLRLAPTEFQTRIPRRFAPQAAYDTPAPPPQGGPAHVTRGKREPMRQADGAPPAHVLRKGPDYPQFQRGQDISIDYGAQASRGFPQGVGAKPAVPPSGPRGPASRGFPGGVPLGAAEQGPEPLPASPRLQEAVSNIDADPHPGIDTEIIGLQLAHSGQDSPNVSRAENGKIAVTLPDSLTKGKHGEGLTTEKFEVSKDGTISNIDDVAPTARPYVTSAGKAISLWGKMPEGITPEGAEKNLNSGKWDPSTGPGKDYIKFKEAKNKADIQALKMAGKDPEGDNKGFMRSIAGKVGGAAGKVGGAVLRDPLISGLLGYEPDVPQTRRPALHPAQMPPRFDLSGFKRIQGRD